MAMSSVHGSRCVVGEIPGHLLLIKIKVQSSFSINIFPVMPIKNHLYSLDSHMLSGCERVAL